MPIIGTCASLATGSTASSGAEVAGPIKASTWSSVISLRAMVAAAVGSAPSSRIR